MDIIISPQAISHYGGLDILVSNAAVNPHIGPTLDVSASIDATIVALYPWQP